LVLLKQNEGIFNGQLDEWKDDPVEIPLKDEAISYHGGDL
jgi:hypothetical protein